MCIIKKLDIYILKNYLLLFAGTFCISLFVVMMQFLWKYVDDLVGKGLGMTVLAKFFFYAAETLVPLALPLAILLASLISFGNLGERFELLAIKAAGISLFRTLRSLIVLMVILCGASYYFQDVIAPKAQQNLMQLLFSMRQKSPELDIPEGVFYDGIEGINLYVKNKDKESGQLRHLIIYNMRDGVDNAHIILADSGRLVTTADKMHLRLHLYNGEQFENLSSGALQARNVPYRRETFVEKHFLIDFDSNFNMADSETFSTSANTKNMKQLMADIDSLENYYDSLGTEYYNDMKRGALYVSSSKTTPKRDNDDKSSDSIEDVKPLTKVQLAYFNTDSAFNRLSEEDKAAAIQFATQKVAMQQMDIGFKADMMENGNSQIRRHWTKFWEKITMSLACIVFFFIGAPLGSIIRKGGLGLPVAISVVIFIVYYIINTFGTKMGREGSIPVWFGMWLSTFILAPLGIFFTVKSNNDSVVFNMDAYRNFFRKLFGIRTKRYIIPKEVVIYTPDYEEMTLQLRILSDECNGYLRTHKLRSFPNYINIFFRNDRDEQIEEISERLELCVEALSNAKGQDVRKEHRGIVKQVLLELNRFPILDSYAHTAPFRNKKLNILAGVVFPVGIVLTFRIGRFRHRLFKDLRQIASNAAKIAEMTKDVKKIDNNIK